MRIKYRPKYEKDIQHINSISLERQYKGISHWRAGEVKNIPDDLKFRENNHYINLIEDLLSDRSFVLADTGRNPNYVCVKCDVDTFQEFILNADPLNRKPTLLETSDGKRLCVNCFNKQ